MMKNYINNHTKATTILQRVASNPTFIANMLCFAWKSHFLKKATQKEATIPCWRRAKDKYTKYILKKKKYIYIYV